MTRLRRALGDLVTMPLPTCAPWPGGNLIPTDCNWGPEAYMNAAVAQLTPGTQVLIGGQPAPGADGSPNQIPAGPQAMTLGPGGLEVPAPVTGGALPAQGGVWQREPLLPDALLPPALRRSNPLLRYLYMAQQPNRYDGQLARQAALWKWIAAHGGLKSCCRIAELGAPVYDEDPRIVMPADAVRLNKMFSAPLTDFQTAGVFNGVDTVIGEFRVDVGYDGVINKFVCGFNGQGFLDFSGDIVWRVKVAQRYAKDLGNVTNTFGSFSDAMLVPGSYWPLVSGQTVQLIGNIPATSGVSNGVVTIGVFGWFYPHR